MFSEQVQDNTIQKLSVYLFYLTFDDCLNGKNNFIRKNLMDAALDLNKVKNGEIEVNQLSRESIYYAFSACFYVAKANFRKNWLVLYPWISNKSPLGLLHKLLEVNDKQPVGELCEPCDSSVIVQ